MARQDQQSIAHAMLVESTRVVRSYAGSDVSMHVIELLDALATGYCNDLIHVQPEGLIRIQSALKQVAALRSVFANDGVDVPKI